MNIFGTILALSPCIVWGILGIILVYLIFRRIRIKKEEDFEDRDN